MNILYLIGFLIIAKLFYSVYKSDRLNKKKIHYKSDSEMDKIDLKSSIEMPNELGKNKWLYPKDDFGIMEEGRSL